MDSKVEELSAMYKKTIAEGEQLLLWLNDGKLSNVRGIHKLQRKIQKDILFLVEVLQSNKMKKEHLVCTNLNFYKVLVQETLHDPECEAVLETFSFKASDGCQKRLTVDIVSLSTTGQQWVKTIARNPTALQQIYKGESFGKRSITHQAIAYVRAASQNLHLYRPPQIIFYFANGVPEKMKVLLEKLGISVKGDVISSFYEISEDEEESYCSDDVLPKQKYISRLNLCVTTMIAYVSSLTNGGCDSKFEEPLLNQQAEWERVRPVKPFLDSIFEGKELISCSTAVEDFKNIINMVGGEEEKVRASALLSNITMVIDSPFPGLQPSGKLKKRSLLIFGTGHAHEAITVTANKGFVQGAKQKGVKFAVIIHESRALTERKQIQEIFIN